MPITFDDIRGKAAAAHGAKLNTAPEKLGPPAPGHDVAGPFSSRLKAIANPLDTGPPVKPIQGTPSKNVINIRTPHAVRVVGDELQGALTRNVATGNSLVAHPVRTLTGHNAQSIERLHVKNGKVVSSGTPAQQRAAMGLLIPAKGVLGSAQEMMGIGPGLGLLAIQGVNDPLGTAGTIAHGIGSSMAGTFTHGHYGSKTNTPLDDAMNLWTAATLGAGAAGRVGEMASADGAKATAKAAIFRPKQAPRVLHVGEGEHARTIVAAASRNPAAALLQRHFYDRLTQHSLNTGQLDLGSVILRRFGSPEARMARLARNHLRVENDLGAAPAAELAKYGQGVTKRAAKGKLGGLTMAQDHAAFISGLGHTPETFARASANAIEHADLLSELEGVPADAIRKNHEDLHAKTALAAQYFDEHGHLNHPLVKKAVAAMQRAISAREDTRGMTADEIHHALGSRWYAVHHLAENPTGQSLHQQLETGLRNPAPVHLSNGGRDTGALYRNFLSDVETQAKSRPYVGQGTEGVDSVPDAATRGDKSYQYLYHRTSLDHLPAIKKNGLAPLEPNADEHGVYFANNPLSARGLSWKRKNNVYLRVARDKVKNLNESRAYGESFSPRAVPPSDLEYLAADGKWHSFNGGGHNAADVSAIHELFRAKGEELHGNGAFYLPQSSETKALTKVRSSVTRRPGPYGFAAPKGEKAYAQMGHLFNTGDYRTQAVPLAQHAFGKAKLLQSQQRLHEMMLALSKSTPEEVGHTHPIPIRVNGAPSNELKRFINELYQGDHGKAEGSAAEALWKELMPGHVPKGEAVRFLHPDVAGIFKPHHASELARNVGRFNQLVRGARFLNPKYGIWNVQNAAVGIHQQGAMMPFNWGRYLKVVRRLDPETYSKIESTVGAGMSKSLTAPGDQKVVQHLAGFWHHVNDHMYRMMSFTHEARVMGYHTAADFKRLMNSTDPKVVADRHQIIQAANREAIDYGAMTSTEAESVRRYAAYWPWTRAATAWTLRMAKEHPLWAQLNLEAGRKGKKFVDSFYANHGGMAPPNEEGNYPAKSGPIDMEAFNTPSTLGQDMEAVSGIFSPNATKYLNGTAISQAAPAVKLIQELGTGLNKYGSAPKSGSVFGQTLHDLGSSIEPLQLVKSALGKGRPANGATPSGFKHEAERWAGWPQESGVNYDSLAQLGASIDKKSLRGPAQAAADTVQKLRDVAQLAKARKMPSGYAKSFSRYFSREGARSAQLTKAAWDSGSTSDDYKKAESALAFNHPDLYYMATAKTVAGIFHVPQVEKSAAVFVKRVMSGPLTADQKATVLRTQADKWWGEVNPKSIKTAYYNQRDLANLH